MRTFKQYYLKEMGWNPRSQLKNPGDPGKLRELTKTKPTRKVNVDPLTSAEQMVSNPDQVDYNTGKQVLDDLGRSFDNPDMSHLQQEIITKYRELRELLKAKSAQANQQNMATVASECVQIAKQLIDLLNG